MSKARDTTVNLSRGLMACVSLVLVAGCMPEEDSSHGESVVQHEQNLVGGVEAAPGEWDSAIYWANNSAACSGSVVSSRHILTAAHCVMVYDFNRGLGFGQLSEGLRPGAQLLISNDKVLSQQGNYEQHTISRVEMHPAWTQACLPGCPYNISMIPPFAPDLALITVREDISTHFERARVLTGPLLPGVPVSIMGYGCEAGVGQQGRTGRLKHFSTRTVDSSFTQHAFSFVSAANRTVFDRHYVITPGQDLHGEASLCSGDSGGPLYLTDVSDGEIVVGVNAYYTFRNANGGISTTNAHTRLGRDNPSRTGDWLVDRLPISSLAYQGPKAAFDDLGLRVSFDVEIEGSDVSDLLEGMAGSEKLLGYEGDDRLLGGRGDDELDGGPQNDWLDGGEGHDLLRGGPGADVLDGGPGQDVLMGGRGPDVYVMSPGGGHDLVFDDGDGQNQVVCQGFEEPPIVYVHGEDSVVWSADGTQSLRVVGSNVISFYGCTRPPINFPF